MKYRLNAKLIIVLFFSVLTASAAIAGDDIAHAIRPAAELFTPAQTPDALNQLLADAKTAKKPVLIEFYASWCGICAEMDASIFSDQSIQKLLQSFQVLRVDVTRDTPELKLLQERYKVYGTPTIIFYGRNGDELAEAKIVGESTVQEFQKVLRSLQ